MKKCLINYYKKLIVELKVEEIIRLGNKADGKVRPLLLKLENEHSRREVLNGKKK